MYEDQEEVIYVTSIIFEQEPEFGENKPSDKHISQYPIEEVLEKFYCHVSDLYEKENLEDSANSYVEVASDDIQDIEKFLTIIGKHVYNKTDGEYIKLIIE